MVDENNNRGLLLNVQPWEFFKFILSIIITLHMLSGIAVWADFAGFSQFDDVIEFFDVGHERNIPTMYSALAWCVAALITWLVARNEAALGRPFIGRWYALAAIFLFLGFDEGTTIHEHIGTYVKGFELFPATGIFYFFWVVPYGVLLLILASLYAPFMDALPNKTKWGLVASAIVFLGGAMGVEMVSASVYEVKEERHSLLYHVLYSIEEFMEMLGVAMLVYFMLDYFKTKTAKITIEWGT